MKILLSRHWAKPWFFSLGSNSEYSDTTADCKYQAAGGQPGGCMYEEHKTDGRKDHDNIKLWGWHRISHTFPRLESPTKLGSNVRFCSCLKSLELSNTSTSSASPVLTMSGHGGLLFQSQNNQTSWISISPSLFLLILAFSKVFILPLSLYLMLQRYEKRWTVLSFSEGVGTGIVSCKGKSQNSSLALYPTQIPPLSTEEERMCISIYRNSVSLGLSDGELIGTSIRNTILICSLCSTRSKYSSEKTVTDTRKAWQGKADLFWELVGKYDS